MCRRSCNGLDEEDHEGQTMWEQDGERVKEVPDERTERVIERIDYYAGIGPAWIPWCLLLGCLAGMLLAASLGLSL